MKANPGTVSRPGQRPCFLKNCWSLPVALLRTSRSNEDNGSADRFHLIASDLIVSFVTALEGTFRFGDPDGLTDPKQFAWRC